MSKETLGVYPGVPGTGEVTDGERSEEARESGERMDEDIVGGEEEVDGGESDVRVVDVSILKFYQAERYRLQRSLNHAIRVLSSNAR